VKSRRETVADQGTTHAMLALPPGAASPVRRSGCLRRT
jgi:hypothetical protein